MSIIARNTRASQSCEAELVFRFACRIEDANSDVDWHDSSLSYALHIAVDGLVSCCFCCLHTRCCLSASGLGSDILNTPNCAEASCFVLGCRQSTHHTAGLYAYDDHRHGCIVRCHIIWVIKAQHDFVRRLSSCRQTLLL